MPRPKKICWCTPTCGKLLTKPSRLRHYNALTAAERANRGRSASPPPLGDSDDNSHHSFHEELPDDLGDSDLPEGLAPFSPGLNAYDVSMTSDHSQLISTPMNFPLAGGDESQDMLDLSQDISMLALSSSAGASDNEQEDEPDLEYLSDFDKGTGALDKSLMLSDNIEIPIDEDEADCPPLVDPDSDDEGSDDDDASDRGEEERWCDEEEDFNIDLEDHLWEGFNEAEELAIFMDEQQRLKAFEEMMESEQIDKSGIPYDRLAELSSQDIDDIQAFKLRLLATMPRRVFNEMRFCFRHKLQISSPHVIAHKLAMLSGIKPEYIDCCVSSCVAYTKEYKDLTACPVCNEPRLDQSGKVRKTFCYIPLIPRLQHFFLNPTTREELMYRHHYLAKDGVIADVFDGQHYRQLRDTFVKVDGKTLGHTFFCDPRDIAFATCMDSYLLYGKHKRSGPSAMPILVQLYNLKPQIRTHIERTLCLGFVPGPRSPKELHTFLAPFEDERIRLAHGVQSYDTVAKEEFRLHAYDIFTQGDIIAIEKFLNIKGHNAKKPCRSCDIQAVNNPGSKAKTYYVPLQGTNLDPAHLPLRRHSDWQIATTRIEDAATQKARNAIAMATGIKGLPVLSRVNSLDYARGIPWDFMHLLFENIVKNLVRLWMGKFKGLDEGNGTYVISDLSWAQIGIETVEATKTIPSAFVRSLHNIFTDQGNYNAEAWSFWFMYVAPHLLKGRFRDIKYYDHFLALVSIMQSCMQFVISEDELKLLESDIISWIQDYERFYYQSNIDRLSVCTLTVHGLLHIPDNIRFCGPVWTTWTFWMERFCGYMQAGLRSRVHPWADLKNRILHKAFLDQIELYYRLEDAFGRPNDEQEVTEEWIQKYEPLVLKPPILKKFQPDKALLTKVAEYFVQILGASKTDVLKMLPKIMPSWGKLLIKNGGDSIRTLSASQTSEIERDMSFIRYEIEYEGPGGTQRTINYGRLIRVLQCQLDFSNIWGSFKGQTCLLALIEPCQTYGKDATVSLVEYDRTLANVVTDLRNVQCVIGRLLRGKKWGIIDRSGPLARSTFSPEALANAEVGDDEDAFLEM